MFNSFKLSFPLKMSFINQNPVVKPVKLIYHQPNTTVYINLHLVPVRLPGLLN